MTREELAEEFRRLAAEADSKKDLWDSTDEAHVSTWFGGQSQAFEQAAQMVEKQLVAPSTTPPPSSGSPR